MAGDRPGRPAVPGRFAAGYRPGPDAAAIAHGAGHAGHHAAVHAQRAAGEGPGHDGVRQPGGVRERRNLDPQPAEPGKRRLAAAAGAFAGRAAALGSVPEKRHQRAARRPEEVLSSTTGRDRRRYRSGTIAVIEGEEMPSKAAPLPRTLGALRESSFSEDRIGGRSVKDELRNNLICGLQRGEALFPGIVGYEDTVAPQIVNAVLSRHNFILLGLRGQAKTRQQL